MSFAFAQEQKEAVQASSPDVMTIKFANELAQYGYANKSVLSLAEAARILASVQTAEMQVEKVERGAKAEVKDATEYTPTQLLADAKKYAGNDATLLAVVDKAEKEVKAATERAASTNRGRVGGAASQYDAVAGNSYIIYYVNFQGGYTAEVGVVGSGNTDLDLYIYDQNGNLIAQDIDYTDVCYCRWVPRWTGTFLIKVVNRGSYTNRFLIATN